MLVNSATQAITVSLCVLSCLTGRYTEGKYYVGVVIALHPTCEISDFKVYYCLKMGHYIRCHMLNVGHSYSCSQALSLSFYVYVMLTKVGIEKQITFFTSVLRNKFEHSSLISNTNVLEK